MLGSGRKEGCIQRLRHTVGQIVAKLREAEVALSKGQSMAHANSCPLPRKQDTRRCCMREETTYYMDLLTKGLGRYNKSTKCNIAIVGAGMAGLVAAWLLQRAGLQVRLYEASQRVGGRVRTLREGFSSGLYAEAGAMRIPAPHKLTLHLCKTFGLQLT